MDETWEVLKKVGYDAIKKGIKVPGHTNLYIQQTVR